MVRVGSRETKRGETWRAAERARKTGVAAVSERRCVCFEDDETKVCLGANRKALPKWGN